MKAQTLRDSDEFYRMEADLRDIERWGSILFDLASAGGLTGEQGMLLGRKFEEIGARLCADYEKIYDAKREGGR